MLLLLIRHGESEADILNVHEGRADFNLTEKGRSQAEKAASFVKENFKITKIFASPLKRAAQTAEYLSSATGIGIEFRDDLMEFNNGLLAGLSREEAARRYPEIKGLPIDKSVYGQESLLEFRQRADAALAYVLSCAEDDDTIAVVSHGGMINQLYRSLIGLPVASDVSFGTGDTGIHVWKKRPNGWLLVKANMTEHLK